MFKDKAQYNKVKLHFGNSIQIIEVVKDYKYLGMWFANNDKKHTNELSNRSR